MSPPPQSWPCPAPCPSAHASSYPPSSWQNPGSSCDSDSPTLVGVLVGVLVGPCWTVAYLVFCQSELSGWGYLPFRGAGTGGLGLAIEGPSEAKMSCKDNKDGSCAVEYVPFTAGDYDVNITFGGRPIPGGQLGNSEGGSWEAHHEIGVGCW